MTEELLLLRRFGRSLYRWTVMQPGDDLFTGLLKFGLTVNLIGWLVFGIAWLVQ